MGHSGTAVQIQFSLLISHPPPSYTTGQQEQWQRGRPEGEPHRADITAAVSLSRGCALGIEEQKPKGLLKHHGVVTWEEAGTVEPGEAGRTAVQVTGAEGSGPLGWGGP